MCISFYFLVSENESENSTEGEEDSIQSTEAEVGLKSLLNDEDNDETSIEKKVCRNMQSQIKTCQEVTEN
jgi:hypothetical protein